MPAPFLTKPGKHGTLYRYAVRYRCAADRDASFVWRTWAYDAEHAVDLFHRGPDADGWRVVGTPRRVRETR